MIHLFYNQCLDQIDSNEFDKMDDQKKLYIKKLTEVLDLFSLQSFQNDSGF